MKGAEDHLQDAESGAEDRPSMVMPARRRRGLLVVGSVETGHRMGRMAED